MNARSIAVFCLAVALAASSALAHHNMSAIFDFNNRVALKGTLSKVHWTNPHILLIVDAKEGDKAVTWSFERPVARVLSHPRRRQGRFRGSHRSRADDRRQPRTRRVALGAATPHHPARWKGRVVVSAELLIRTRARSRAFIAATVCAMLATVPTGAHESGAAGEQAASSQPAARPTAARAKRIAEQFERDARVLTVFDRAGKLVSRIGERALYANPPVFSPDRTRVAVVTRDPEKENRDLWVLDAATGAGTQITFSERGEWAGSPVWSPDGREIAYAALRAGYEGIYRNRSNGESAELLLHRHPGAGIIVTDWSMDGRYLLFGTTDLAGGILYALPLADTAPRTPIAFLRSDFQITAPRLSPDGRFVVYRSDESGRMEVYSAAFRAFGERAFSGRAVAGVEERWRRHGVMAPRWQRAVLHGRRSRHDGRGSQHHSDVLDRHDKAALSRA